MKMKQGIEIVDFRWFDIKEEIPCECELETYWIDYSWASFAANGIRHHFIPQNVCEIGKTVG